MSRYTLQTTLPALERSLAVFRPHHLELRKRLITIILAIICCSTLAYFFAEQIAGLLVAPLFHASPLVHKLIYTNLPEAFVSYLKLSLLVGIVFSYPIILFQIWAFIAPGLKNTEKKLALTVVFWGTMLFAAGACFAFFAVTPRMLIFLMSYAHKGLEPMPKLGLYLTFIARTILTFGLSFQIPFLMVMAGKANLVQSVYFRKKRLYFYAAILVLSFLLTAGDVTATVLLAFPLFLLYEAGIFLTSLFAKKSSAGSEVM